MMCRFLNESPPPQRSFQMLRILSALSLMVAITAIGCSNNQVAPDQGIPVVPKVQPSKTNTQPDTVEPGEKGSGIDTRTYVHGGISGTTVVEIRVAYSDGDRAVLRLRDDGTLSECHEFFGKSADVKSRSTFAADGKTLVTGEFYKKPGLIYFKVERVNDKQIRIDRYWIDGKYVWSSELTDEAGNAEVTYFAPGGKDKVAVLSLRETDNTAYGRRRAAQTVHLRPDGVPSHTIGYLDHDAHYVTWYAADGKTPTHRQQWWMCYVPSNPGMRGALERIEEFEADGKTPKRTIYCREKPKYHHTVTGQDVFEKGKLAATRLYDNTTTSRKTEIERFPLIKGQPVRQLITYTLKSEEQFDAAGQVTKTTQYTQKDAVYDSFDVRLFRTPLNHVLEKMEDQYRNYSYGLHLKEIPPKVYDPARRWYSTIEISR